MTSASHAGGDLIVVQGLDGSVRLADPSSGSSDLIWEGEGVQFGDGHYDPADDSIWLTSADELIKLTLDSVRLASAGPVSGPGGS